MKLRCIECGMPVEIFSDHVDGCLPEQDSPAEIADRLAAENRDKGNEFDWKLILAGPVVMRGFVRLSFIEWLLGRGQRSQGWIQAPRWHRLRVGCRAPRAPDQDFNKRG